jgi:L-ascorbate metabolism protein UlaG (beta-lactamase superfamily)
VLLLSHNHWDHLDMATVKEIYKHHHPVILTPLGVKAFLDREGVAGALDLNWWEERELQESIMVQSVPAQHFSGRGLFDRDATLWCGYVIRRPGGNIYFVGDTGYHEQAFKEIGERCAPIELALVPIGAFKPEWFMSPIHCSPAEAVKLHQDVGARTSIATHFGTFPLADDGQHEPIERLQEALRLAGIDSTSFAVLTEGVSYVFPQRS